MEGHSHRVDAVTEGKAAVRFMGDWAKGEIVNKGQSLGNEISCDLAPGTESNYQPVFDVFLQVKVTASDEIEGQKLLMKVFEDKSVSIGFNNLQGCGASTIRVV